MKTILCDINEIIYLAGFSIVLSNGLMKEEEKQNGFETFRGLIQTFQELTGTSSLNPLTARIKDILEKLNLYYISYSTGPLISV